ncbi:hypothetical protein CR983_02685 [Candidatus Saccharibacteria bacterium]|nr:MAG: hypothetical protein CR983_02685 [Candidatus Saccharibacteria bacterium]
MLLALIVIVQLLYPRDRLLPFVQIDGQAVGLQRVSEAAEQLNTQYRDLTLTTKLAINDESIATPTLDRIGASVDTAPQLESLNYSFWARLVPSSLLWAARTPTTEPTVSYDGDQLISYIEDDLMKYCRQAPTNATLRAVDGKLEVVSAKPGGACERDGVEQSLRDLAPRLNQPLEVVLPVTPIEPAVRDDQARSLADSLQPRLDSGVPLVVGGQTIKVPAATAAAWLAFTVHDDTLQLEISPANAAKYLDSTIAPKLAKPAGTSYITTRDFTVIAERRGQSGRALDTAATLASVRDYLLGKRNDAQASAKVIPPKKHYTRSYSPSDRGFSALFANFADDNPGTYGIAMIELDGRKRRADYNGDKQFITASTYKLFTAYTLLKRIDQGRESWPANKDCFVRMISHSDNPCAEAYIEKFGWRELNQDQRNLGLKKSNFNTGGPFTSANDLALFLGQLQTGQNFSSAGRDRLLSAMRGNIFRRGIPAGVSGTVADKVGFIDALLHDAAIVDGPKGTYVLVILSEGSSWERIAALARQVEQLRTK